MINWFYYPKSTKPPSLVLQVVDAFREAYPAIASYNHKLPSNQVLAEVRSGLEGAGFLVETGKKASEKILVPVLFGLNGSQEKSFEADAYYESKGSYILGSPGNSGVAGVARKLRARVTTFDE